MINDYVTDYYYGCGTYSIQHTNLQYFIPPGMYNHEVQIFIGYFSILDLQK